MAEPAPKPQALTGVPGLHHGLVAEVIRVLAGKVSATHPRTSAARSAASDDIVLASQEPAPARRVSRSRGPFRPNRAGGPRNRARSRPGFAGASRKGRWSLLRHEFLLNAGDMEALHEFHACDGVRLPFGTACGVLDRHRHDILERASRLMVARPPDGPAAGWLGAEARVVTAPLERDGERSATMAMHWIRAGAPDQAEGGLTAWLHAHLRLVPRLTGGQAITELLLTARCETTPPEPDAFGDELCASFLREVAAEIERKAAAERVPQ